MVGVDFTWVDVTRHLQEQLQPVMMLERPRIHDQPKAWAGTSQVSRTGEFWVPISSVLDQPVKWTTVTTGEFVRVPLFAYRTTAAESMSSLFGLGVQLGLLASGPLAEQKIVPIHVTVVVGHECHLMPDGTYRGYVGFSFRTK